MIKDAKLFLNYNNRTLLYWLAGFFVVVNLFYFFLGVRFTYASLNGFMHFIDPNLLKSNLFESLFFLHSQPPLFNFFLGVVLNLFPDNLQLAFALIYLICGLLFTLVLFSLMVKLGVHPVLAFITTSIFIASPAFILYENWLYSTFFEAFLLCLSALFLYQFIERNSLKSGIAFFLSLALLILLRSSFHLVWFVAVAFFIYLMNRNSWRRILIAGAIPFLIIVALYGKNYLIFGSFTSSTWLGMNFSSIALPPTSSSEFDELIQSGEVSPVVKISRFNNLASYKQFYTPSPRTGIQVLDDEYKSVAAVTGKDAEERTGINFNNINYIELNDKFLKADLYYLTHHPLDILANVAASSIVTFKPSNHYLGLSSDNLNSVAIIDRIYTFLFDGDFFQFLDDSGKPFWSTNTLLDFGWFNFARFMIAVIFGLKLLLSKKNSKRSRPFTITIFFLLFTILYYISVSNIFDFGENNRFRFDIDPFCLIIFTLFLQQIFLHFRKRKSALVAPEPGMGNSQAGANREIMAG